MIDVLVPFRFGDDPARERAWQFVRAWYGTQHRGFTIHVGALMHDCGWSKGAALRCAFARSKGDILVLADADVLVDPTLLVECVQLVRDGAPWAQPHDRVYRLSRLATSATYQRVDPPDIINLGNQVLERRMHPAPAGGGIVVLSRDAYTTVGGIDPRFIGWGGDDISFARALDTLVGPRIRLNGALWHLWHPRAERQNGNRASLSSERLAARYLDASDNVAAMRAVVDEFA